MSIQSVPFHQLGKNGPLVPALGFGLMGMSYAPYGAIPGDEERFAILDRAVELGATFWDTSDLYGDSEALLAKWFKRTGKREQIFLGTKFGFVKGNWLHNANPETPIEETMSAMMELQAEGKIKHIGLSAISSTTLRRACKIGTVAAVQTEYAVFTRDIESTEGTNLLATCRELGVAIVVLAPLGRGLLTSTFSNGDNVGDSTDSRPKNMPRFLEENREHNVKVAGKFKALADKKGCTVSQLALAWLLKQGDDIFPIPGTKKLKYLEENWGALGISLSDEEEAEIRDFAEKNEFAGGPAPDAFAAYLFRDTKEVSAQ
ncbi:Aldo-keto reductase yakc [NADP(+)] [Lachnellula suecica]|uniref:Aldo-keto reductase yakc [NADP(+)] n=1 Tax=Lachnellula suecica TaxID=602035 RepID=A0A8T9CC08_9HELO|nr:Aldo-keto reductase yakc [NADP(+)] [Lachnellula suecica]